MTNVDAIKTRIRKLLALGRNNSSAEEAAVALEKAAALMLEHNIKEDEALDFEAAEISLRIGELLDIRYNHDWQCMLANMVALLYDCRHVISVQHDMRGAFAGRPDNVSACEETMPWILKQVEDIYKHTLKLRRDAFGKGMTTSESDRFRKSFKEAAVVTIGKRIVEIKAAQRGTIPLHKSLVIIDTVEQALDAAFGAMGAQSKAIAIPKVGPGTGAGIVAGHFVNIQRTVEGEG